MSLRKQTTDELVEMAARFRLNRDHSGLSRVRKELRRRLPGHRVHKLETTALQRLQAQQAVT